MNIIFEKCGDHTYLIQRGDRILGGVSLNPQDEQEVIAALAAAVASAPAAPSVVHKPASAVLDEELYARFMIALARLNEHAPPVVMQVEAMDCFLIMSALQLATRHPDAAGSATLRVAEAFGRLLQSRVAATGVLAEVAAMGWQSELDQ